MRVVPLLMASLVLICCEEPSSTIVKRIIPGTYTQYAELQLDEDSHTRVFDTLEIESLGNGARATYRVMRRQTSFKTIDGKALPPGRKTRVWTGTFQLESQAILLNEAGRSISFLPSSNSIMLGTVEYKKNQ